MAWQPCWMTERFVLSSNMAATPLSFGSPGIDCKPRIIIIVIIIVSLFLHSLKYITNVTSLKKKYYYNKR